MSDLYLSEWIRKAEEDYTVATTLARKRKQLTPNAICFHCQQCAEKYLKAFLVQNAIVFRKIHDLRELYRLCLAINPGFELIADLLDQLNPYSIEFRYPGEEATQEEAKLALRAMKVVRRFVQGTLATKG
jgi:HEPN domain-containing protein